MIRMTIIAAVFAAVLLALPAGPAAGAPQGKVVVLGFNSRQLNDVQDRLLREAVLREFHDRGHAIVPVMEIESLLLGDRRRKLRGLARGEMADVCKELDAAYAIAGTLTPESGADDQEIAAGRKFVCDLVIYRHGDGSFREARLTADGENTLLGFFSGLAKAIVKRVKREM